MAQIAEQRKDYPQAEAWLARIDNADDMISAQSRRASILAKQGRLEDGRKLLRALPEKAPSDGRLKLMAEVQLLREFKQYRPAYDMLVAKTKSGPPDWELLYDQAMLAEKIGDLPEMERLLRQIISGKPDYLHAYNALGYSFAERNVRLAEAKTLILKALEFAPNDPFITDSLGWVEFRSGNVAEAARILGVEHLGHALDGGGRLGGLAGIGSLPGRPHDRHDHHRRRRCGLGGGDPRDTDQPWHAGPGQRMGARRSSRPRLAPRRPDRSSARCR